MAPTICSGKKRQTRTIARTNIQRHGQGSQQLNQALSNIVNYVAKGSMNARVSASLRIPTHNELERNHNTDNENSLNYRHSMHTSDAAATAAPLTIRRRQFSFMSDNAISSGTHSDTENSIGLRLFNEVIRNCSTGTHVSNNTNSPPSTSQSYSESETKTTSSLSAPISSNTSPCRGRQFHRYKNLFAPEESSKDVDDDGDDDDDDDDDERNLYDDTDQLNRETNQIHSNNASNYDYACSEFDSGEDFDVNELDDEKELNDDFMGVDSDSDAASHSDMNTNEDDSMTSLDTEKSAKLKRGNHPLLRDKLLEKQQTNSKTFTNTDGLLSIAIKTIKLVKRNQLLQQRLTQLQLETSEFIQSVLANPENRHFRENIKKKVQEVNNV